MSAKKFDCLFYLFLLFTKPGERLFPSQYRPVTLSNVNSKPFEAILKDIVTYLYRNNNLSNKQYGFRLYGSTADVLTVVTRIISEALDGVLDLFLLQALL